MPNWNRCRRPRRILSGGAGKEGANLLEFAQAVSAEDIDRARELFKEYAAALGVDLCFQNFEKELAELPGAYAPPDGRLLLAFDNEELAGCVAVRKLGDGVCEMKRRFLS